MFKSLGENKNTKCGPLYITDRLIMKSVKIPIRSEIESWGTDRQGSGLKSYRAAKWVPEMTDMSDRIERIANL
jgi:hypothetical protein